MGGRASVHKRVGLVADGCSAEAQHDRMGNCEEA